MLREDVLPRSRDCADKPVHSQGGVYFSRLRKSQRTFTRSPLSLVKCFSRVIALYFAVLPTVQRTSQIWGFRIRELYLDESDFRKSLFENFQRRPRNTGKTHRFRSYTLKHAIETVCFEIFKNKFEILRFSVDNGR